MSDIQRDDKFLFNPNNNDVYPYEERLASYPGWEVRTAEEVYPHLFVAPAQEAKLAEAKKRGRPRLALETDLPPDPDTTPPELAADAARGFGKRLGGLSTGPSLQKAGLK